MWALGVASLLMDSSSELIHSLLPVFLTTVLGASVLSVAWIEGVAEATGAFAKVFAGALSDRWRRRKPLVLLGYSLAASTKPWFPLASSIGWVFAARFVDRVGKGIRGAPRDALVADLVPPDQRGAAFGLRQALDSVGALLGPGLALLLVAGLAFDLVSAMWVAVVPAILTVVVLLLFVREPEREPAAVPRARLPWHGARSLPLRFWGVVALGALFTTTRFSEAFLVLRAHDVGLPTALAPLVLVVMNAGYAVLAFPAGAAADRIDPRRLLLGGLGALVGADLVLAFAGSPVAALGGVALWGVHLALTQGLLSKLVADAAPAPLLATAFGVFHLVTGGALLAASLVAGVLWSRVSPSATFLAGAALATSTAVALLGIRGSVSRS